MMSTQLDDFFYHNGEDIDAAMEEAVTPAQLREAAEFYKRLRERHALEWREANAQTSKKGA